jgi:hypothetical protein
MTRGPLRWLVPVVVAALLATVVLVYFGPGSSSHPASGRCAPGLTLPPDAVAQYQHVCGEPGTIGTSSRLAP